MSDTRIWRYLSLAKYIDLLRSQSLFFPKASLFPDSSEGKWVTDVLLGEQFRDDALLEDHTRELEALLAGAEDDTSALAPRAAKLLQSRHNNRRDVLHDVLSEIFRLPPSKRRGRLESYISSWRELRRKHDIDRTIRWIPEVKVHRESTYISCWNGTFQMSYALWELYAGGVEGVAIRSTEGKLRNAIDYNSTLLEGHGLIGGVAKVKYFEGLPFPSEETQLEIKNILINADETRIGQFSIKPSIFKYEEEIRAIIFPKLSPFDPVHNPHPEIKNGFSLPIGQVQANGVPSVTNFIDALYIHPTLGRNSMMFQMVNELNRRFDAEKIEIIAEPIEPSFERTQSEN